MITGGRVLRGWPRGMLIGFACWGMRRGVVIGVRGCQGMGILTMGARGLSRVVVPGILGRIRPWVVGMGGQGSGAVSAAVRLLVAGIFVGRDPLLERIGGCS